MTRFSRDMLDPVLRWEGGYVDDAADPGGATRYGITRKTLSRRRGRRVSKVEVRALTRAEAVEIYRARYWDACRCGELPAPLALAVFDCAVNQGPKRARKLLQKAAGVAADGVIGPLTLAAVEKAPSTEILGAFMARRALHYAGLAQLLRFGRGWFRRLFDIHRRALALS